MNACKSSSAPVAALVAVCLICGADPASAAAVLTTDATSYNQGDVVQLTFTNNGPGSVYTPSSPPLGIQHVATEVWVLMIGNLPEVIEVEPGESLIFTHDTADGGIDSPGLYRGLVFYYYEDWVERYEATAEYNLEEAVPAPSTVWSELKCLYR